MSSALLRSELVAIAVRQQVLSLGAAEVVLGDLRNADAVHAALRDTDAVYFICPRFAEDEPAMGALWIAQAEAAGIKRFVYQAVAHPYIQAMPHHWDKLQVQLMLEHSRLPYTVLQPITWVDADDVAEVAARVLTEPGHDGGAYELMRYARRSDAHRAVRVA